MRVRLWVCNYNNFVQLNLIGTQYNRIVNNHVDFISSYTQTRHTTGTGPFTCRGVQDGFMVTATSVATKFWLGSFGI